MSDKTELRGLCPNDLAQALDAIAMSEGMDRNSYVVKVLHEKVVEVTHKQMMLARTLKGNPYLKEGGGNE